ncbi:TPA: hypothetical protein PFE21_004474 [Kluyvera ascorbata]|uniref:hypothetical protein n=1 Tax=Kluyvera ascorbata TaxID=51288 RepID=UPI002915A6AB|nr:hypothetical protein [Kluyvera ascorbata]MDU3912048.1 hypothetical protein [Kluyvera ascorbata]HDG1723123.1 hypothetical protein [Kluyvera ascorbata]
MNDITALAQREKFEAWAEEVGALPWGILKKHRNQDGSYPGPHYSEMWKAWQAACNELVEALEKAQQRIAELETYSKTAIEFREAARDESRHLKLELKIAEKRIAELEKAASEPVAWTDEAELRDVEKDGCGYLFKANPITPHADPRRVIKLYTVSPAQESRTVTVKLPTGYVVRPGHPINEGERGVMIPKDGGTWLSRFDVEHMLRVAGIQVIEGEA